MNRSLGTLVCAVALAVGTLVVVPPPAVALGGCTTGAHGARLAADPAGDTTFGGQPAPDGTTDDQEDIRFVDATADETRVAFTVGVEDLGTGDPPASSGLLVALDIATASGATFTVNASRSVARMEPGSGDINGAGAAEGVTATFDAAANTIAIAGPASVLPGRAGSFQLINAETRADGAVIVAPLTDTAVGDCVYEFAPLPPRAPFDRSKVTLTIVDTGIAAANPEFDFDETQPGPNGQLVGWWDFSGTTKHPDCGPATTAWCTTVAPYDPDITSGSHGTGTSGMAAGTNASAAKTPSACPGCNLAVAKVKNEDDDTLAGSVADAIRWAVDVVHTDVISVSIGAAAPIPEPFLHDVYLAHRYARDHGVLVVYSNGNGWGNAGGPGQPGGFTNYGNSVDVLSVGASDLDGLLATTDPEVTAAYTVVTAASPGADTDGTADGYHSISGTSFGAPFVAGVAAHLISSGRLCSAPDLTPDTVEQLIKDTAIDTVMPPSNEGYGEVNLGTLDTALGVLCNGEDRPVPDPVTQLYTDHVSGTERMVSSDAVSMWTLDGPTIVKLHSRANGAGVLGVSTPTIADAEIYAVTLLPGQSLDVLFSYDRAAPESDFDVFAYNVTKRTAYDGHTIVARAASEAGVDERLVYRNTRLTPMKLHIAVVGYTLIDAQRFATSTPLGAPVFEGIAAVTIPLA